MSQPSPVDETEPLRTTPLRAFAVAAVVALIPAATLLPKSSGDSVWLADATFDHAKSAIIDAASPGERALRKRVRALGLQNVVVSLCEPHDPRLPADSLDVAILVHMYHEIAQPYALLYNLVPALKPGARVGIVDALAPTSEHGTPPSVLRCELAAVGYREISLDRLDGSNAYLAIFAPPSIASRTRPEAIVACKSP